MNDSKHKNYELLNLIGYGLAKFDMDFVREFDCKTKVTFYEYIVSLKIAETIGVIKNRQDLFDPFFDNGRKGWWQKGETYIHRKILIDSLFGDLTYSQYAQIVKMSINQNFRQEEQQNISPIMKSRFKQMQVTGQEAEIFFMYNYTKVPIFSKGIIEDARLLGDGYDFQIQVDEKYFLVEVKGIKASLGSFRLTENEYKKANDHKSSYSVIIISNLSNIPKMTVVFNPIESLNFRKQVVTQTQLTYHSDFISW